MLESAHGEHVEISDPAYHVMSAHLDGRRAALQAIVETVDSHLLEDDETPPTGA